MIGKNEFKKSLFFFFLILVLCLPTKTNSFLGFVIPPFVLIAATLGAAGVTFVTRHVNAKNFISFQNDIAFYSITIKTKSGKKTESMITYTATNPETVINETMKLIKSQNSTSWFSIKPKVSLMTGETYFLGIITKDKKPRKEHSIKTLENRIEKKLYERFIVPICPNQTYLEKIVGRIALLPLKLFN